MDYLFYKHQENCPWYEEGDCIGTKSACEENLCPMFYWVNCLADHLEAKE